MSRECPQGGGAGGGGDRACFKVIACHKFSKFQSTNLTLSFQCKQEGHMSRDCPNASAGGGSRACHKVILKTKLTS